MRRGPQPSQASSDRKADAMRRAAPIADRYAPPMICPRKDKRFVRLVMEESLRLDLARRSA